MNRQRYYNYISEKIETLALRIKTNGKLNILDLNIHSETFYRDFMNILYDYNLQSSNVGKANYEAIDLIDKDESLIVQVTSTATTTKIKETLKKEKIKDFAQSNFKLKFLFLADDAKNLREKKYLNEHKIIFDPRIDIIDKISILEDVSQAKIDKLAKLYDMLMDEFGEKPNSIKVISNLATIINVLSKENLVDYAYNTTLNEYDIDKKIDFNELGEIKESTFNEYKGF